MRLTRRRALAAGGAGLLTGLAGCSGSGGGGSGNTDTGDGGGSETPVDGQTSDDSPTLATHPASRDAADQPFLGPPPGEATGTIVAFEDPSCPTCARFERETVPQIRANLVDPGDATFVFRGIPVVYRWGQPATRALEATFARDPAAHFTLADHYFSNQSSFRGGSDDDVLSATAAVLDAETDVDGAAVAEAVRAGEADAAVQADLDARTDAEVRATPTIFLFRDGRLVTQVRGAAGYPVIEGALGL
jgi:protein-disulfide isomerase